MAVEICPNEGKQYIGQNAISGRTVYPFLIFGQTVAGATITATSTLAALQEENAGGYGRGTIVLGAIDATGIMVVPKTSFTAGSGWHNNITAWGIASAITGGVAIFVWDLSVTRDLSVSGRVLNLPDPAGASINLFFKNPGE